MTTPAVATQASGSVILVQILTQGPGVYAGLSDNMGNAYTMIGGAQNYAGSAYAESYLFKAENAKGGPGHTWSLTKSSGHAADESTIFVVEVTGAPSSGAVGTPSYLNTATYDGAPLTTTASNSIVVSFWGPADYSGGTVDYTPPASWTRLDQVTDASNSNSGADAYQMVAASGTSVNPRWSSSQWLRTGGSMWLVEVRP